MGRSGLFPARFPGECENCGDSFDEAELIGYAEDMLMCEICHECEEESEIGHFDFE